MIAQYKIPDFEGFDIEGLPDKPSAAGLTAAQLKARFDSISKNLTAPSLNALIDALLSTSDGDSGGHNIGSQPIDGLAGDTVRAQTAALLGRLLSEYHNKDYINEKVSDKGAIATINSIESPGGNIDIVGTTKISVTSKGKVITVDAVDGQTAPKSHAASHKKGGADALTAADIGAMDGDKAVVVSLGSITPDADGNIALTAGTGIALTASKAALKITATGQSAPGAHAGEHGLGGSDPLTPESIGAAPLEALPLIHTTALSIPRQAWHEWPDGGWYAEVQNELLRENRHIGISLSMDSLEAAALCEFDPAYDALDGWMRFYAARPPDVEITGEYVVLGQGGGLSGAGAETASEEDIANIFE